jgi:membrane protease YdiL (CAAX protease family)
MRSPFRFFVLVFVFSVPIWLLEPGRWPITAAVGMPLVAALILVYREEGLSGVRNHLARIFDLRKIRPVWYLPLFLLAPTLSLLNYLIQRSMGLPLHAEPANVLVMIPLLFIGFFVLGIGEEAGWTGYATDPLQSRWSALATAILLGLATSLWHLVPLVKMGRSALWIAWWTVWSVPLRIFIVWIYNNTGKSLFAAIVMHAMINLSSSSPFLPRVGSHWDMIILALLTWSAALVIVGVWKPDTLAPQADKLPC